MTDDPSVLLPPDLALSGDYSLTLTFGRAPGESDQETLLDVLQPFIAAGARGGFPSTGVSSFDSDLAIICPPHTDGETVATSIRAKNVSSTAFQILRNMFERTNDEIGPVKRIILKPVAKPDERLQSLLVPTFENQDDAYPACTDPLPFAVIWEDSQFGKSRRCLIEFARDLEPFQVGQVAEIAKLWGTVLEAGGFATPLGRPADIDSVLGAVSQFDQSTVEIEVARFVATENAWNLLINVLVGAPIEGNSITRLVVE